MNRMLGFTVATALALGGAVAQADDNRGFYVGVNVGATKLDIDKNAYDAALSDALSQGGLTALTATSSSSENDASFGAFAGYRILPYLAVEAEWLTLGTGKYEARGDVTDGTITDTIAFDAETDSKGVPPPLRHLADQSDLGCLRGWRDLRDYDADGTRAQQLALVQGQRLGRYPGHALRHRRVVPVFGHLERATRLPALRRTRRFRTTARRTSTGSRPRGCTRSADVQPAPPAPARCVAHRAGCRPG
jgi:hypothetical protein